MLAGDWFLVAAGILAVGILAGFVAGLALGVALGILGR